jgi:hypothetical protein
MRLGAALRRFGPSAPSRAWYRAVRSIWDHGSARPLN